MEITCETKLENILNSQNVEEILTFSAEIQRLTEPRAQNLAVQLQKDAIINAVINDENILYLTGEKVTGLYNTFHTELASLIDEIRSKSINKEREELGDLLEALNKKINNLEDENRRLARKIDAATIESEASKLEQSSNRIYGQIKSYKEKRTEVMKRLNCIASPNATTVSAVGMQEQPPEPSYTTIEDSANGTTMSYDTNNPGIRNLVYTDENGKTVTASYSYDASGRPVCTYIDGDGNVTVYGVDEYGSTTVTVNGEKTEPLESVNWQYAQIFNYQTGTKVEIPILTEAGGTYYAINTPNEMNGDFSYIHNLVYGSCTTDNILVNPNVKEGETITDIDGNPIVDICYPLEQEYPFGYAPQTPTD